MSIEIIELARKHSNDQISRAEWTNALVNNVTLYEGDELIIKNSFIDINPANINTITIVQDVTFTFKYIPYICVCGNFNFSYNGVTTWNSGSPQNVAFYAVDKTDPNQNTWVPYEKSITITVPKNIYTPDSFAEYITDQMSAINFVNGIFPSTSTTSMVDLIITPPVPMSNLPFQKKIGFVQWGYPPTTVVGPQYFEPIGWYSNDPSHETQTISSMTILGGCQSGIEYKNGNFSLFSINPYWLNTSNNWTVQYAYVSELNQYISIDSYGGVLWSGYSDSTPNNSFFNDILGINPLNFIIPSSDYFLSNVNFMAKYVSDRNYRAVLKNTSAVTAINGVYRTLVLNDIPTYVLSPAQVNQLAMNYVEEGIQEFSYGDTLIGSSLLDLQAGGHILINISSIPQTNITRDRGVASISSIMSRQYQNSNTLTGYIDSGIPYQHRGEPLDLSIFNVSLVDPNSRQPLSDGNLGENSTIYIQITRAPKTLVNMKNKK